MEVGGTVEVPKRWCYRQRRPTAKMFAAGLHKLGDSCPHVSDYTLKCTGVFDTDGEQSKNDKTPGKTGVSRSFKSGQGGSRTRTSITGQRILSPQRLPFRHLAGQGGVSKGREGGIVLVL